MKKIKYLVAVATLLLAPGVALANFDTVGHTSGSQIYLTDTGRNYTIDAATRVESYVINSGSIEFSVSNGSIISLSSVDKSGFSYSSNSCGDVTVTCGGSSSELFIQCSNNISAQTITVTPTATCTSSGVSGSPSVGGGGGGGSNYVAPTTQTKTEEKKTTTKKTTTETKKEAVVTCSLTVGGAYKVPGSPAVYYITEDCAKRPFNKSNVFFTYFSSWSDVKAASKSEIDSMKNDTLGFMPWGPKYDPKYGALVKIVSDPKVYLLLGTEKYWITSEDVFNGLKYYWNWIEDIDKALLDKYTIGSEINYTNHHPNYTLIKYASSSKVYRLEPDPKDSSKQVKRHIKDEKTFNTLNFRWDRIVIVSDSETYADGAQMTQ